MSQRSEEFQKALLLETLKPFENKELPGVMRDILQSIGDLVPDNMKATYNAKISEMQFQSPQSPQSPLERITPVAQQVAESVQQMSESASLSPKPLSPEFGIATTRGGSNGVEESTEIYELSGDEFSE